MIDDSMKYDVTDGDIVVVHKTNWNYSERIGEPFQAIVIWVGRNGQPLIVKREEIKNGVYNPYWSTYNDIIEIIGHIELANLIHSVC